MRRALVFGIWLLLALAGVVVVLGVFATRGSVDISDLARLEPDSLVRARAEAKLNAFGQTSEQARLAGRAIPAQVAFTHDEMTALLRDWAGQEHGFGSATDLQLTFRPRTLTLTGVLHSVGLSFPFRLDIAVSAENSERTAEITRFQVGEMYAPGFARSLVLALAESTLDAGLPRLPIAIETLVITDGELLVSGAAVP
ncbi:MAG: hypothetical protein OXR64_15095 [Chloroflexota bacterium]|nr:hypothetical protein [Chloroflexota bacterium]MDE2921161.1 hypothetical protein [Chloroflexota bacterium]